MKITAIMGSPHKGNGYKLVKKIEKNLKSLNKEIELNYIFLSETDLKMCKGCFLCFSKGEDFCPLKDSRESIEKEISESDGVILSSPGYAWNVSGLMKNFIDRISYTLHRPKFFNQSLMVVTNGGSGLKKVNKVLSMCLGGAEKICEISIITTPYETTKKYSEQTNKIIEKNTKKFHNSLLKDKIKPVNLGNLIWFNLFKKMATLSKETIPADFEYYKTKKNYFYETKLNPLKKTIAILISSLAVWSMKKKVKFK